MKARHHPKMEKIKELEAEMKRLNLWQKTPPQWVVMPCFHLLMDTCFNNGQHSTVNMFIIPFVV